MDLRDASPPVRLRARARATLLATVGMATRLFAPGAEDVVYLVDLSGYVFRAYYAVAPLTSPTGEPTHAVFGTINMLERLIRERRPARLAVAMDSRRETFRKAIFPDYKGNRPPPPEDLPPQMVRVAQIVEAWPIPVLQQDGVEADDLIATAVDRARDQGLRVVIVSADKDLMQLLSPDVLMWDSMRNKVVGPPEVEARFGVQVAQLRDLLALMGDSSDNVPGVPSVGPKTACELLGRFGSLEGVYEHLADVERKRLREALQEHRAQAFLSQKLVTLKRDLEIPFDRAALRRRPRNRSRLGSLYDELGFSSLRRALDAADDGEDSVGSVESAVHAEPSSGPSVTDAVLEPAALERVIQTAQATERLALVVHPCSTDRHEQRLAGISLAATDTEAYYVPLAHRAMGSPRQLPWKVVAAALGPLLLNPRVTKAVHGLKRTLVLLQRQGLDLTGVTMDTELASYLMDPELPTALPALVQREGGTVLASLEDVTRSGRTRMDFDEIPVNVATPHAASEARALLQAWPRLSERLGDEQLLGLLQDVELPLARVLARMEAHGVLLDAARLERIGVQVGETLERLEREAHTVAGRSFNVNSPRQLETILFDELGLKPLKRTKTSRSTDAATLEALADQHPLARVVLEHRRLAKLRGTYIDALPGLAHPETGRIHTSWQQAVTATGRLSSTDPNLQNIPIRTEVGRSIRSAFIAPPGHQLVSADYSQIELRVLAHLSRDPVLLDAFHSGQDVHARTASEIFDVPLAQVSTDQRRRAKAVNFGVIYGQGDRGLAKATGLSRTEAGNFIAAYYRRYEGVRRFMLDETLVQARAVQAVRSLLGRRRMVPDIGSRNRAKRLAAERIAMNMPIQGTAADLLKLSMLRLSEPATPGTRMILTVHDELVFEVPDAEVTEAEARIRDAMENVYELAVPLVVDVGHGRTWSEAH